MIFVEQEPTAGKEHPPRPGATIGREGCDINLADSEVSRRHAAIRRLDSGLAIEDLGSTNGTFVNDQRIEGVRKLREGDVVKFGNTSWKVQAAASATTIGQVPVTAPAQATAARQIPVDARPERQPAAPPAAEQPAQPAAGAQGQRGDVPRPDFAPSAIRKVVPPPGAPAAFNPAPPPRSRGSAATRVEATVAAYVVTALTAAGVVAYYITKPFE